MADFEFFFSNPGHHVATLAPVARFTTAQGFTARVHSFCELRGFATPAQAFGATTSVNRLWPGWLRRSATQPVEAAAVGGGRRRSLLQDLAWRTLMAPRIDKALDTTSRLAVLPNDSAYPYDRTAQLLHQRGLPFVLVQEGIRFPLPAESDSRYGLAGAQALAVWGEGSADHFRTLGVEPGRIQVTGSPRFDGSSILPMRTERRAGGPLKILLITNPIDAQGFCTEAEKIQQVAQFVSMLRPLHADGSLELRLRPHPGEAPATYLAALASADRDRLILPSETLETALKAADVAVVMASTVGLEALRQGVPLAVLPTPGHGYVHDYVERRAAIGLALDGSLIQQLEAHAAPSASYVAAAKAYLDHHLGGGRSASEAVGQLMIGLLNEE